jgi:hypothetical protein
MRNSNNFIIEAILCFGQELLSLLYNDENVNTKKYEQGGMVEDDTDCSVDKTEDLGYAVVVED